MLQADDLIREVLHKSPYSFGYTNNFVFVAVFLVFLPLLLFHMTKKYPEQNRAWHRPLYDCFGRLPLSSKLNVNFSLLVSLLSMLSCILLMVLLNMLKTKVTTVRGQAVLTCPQLPEGKRSACAFRETDVFLEACFSQPEIGGVSLYVDGRNSVPVLHTELKHIHINLYFGASTISDI